MVGIETFPVPMPEGAITVAEPTPLPTTAPMFGGSVLLEFLLHSLLGCCQVVCNSIVEDPRTSID